MRISEIFYSIQGEGELTGVPSVFIRTSGCNLRCRWCDTKYASWDPQGNEMSVADIVAEVKQHPAHHCVITGGEPMVAKGIRDLCQALKDAGLHITIETAATVSPDGIACDLASLSPKLSNSTPLPGEIGDGWIAKHEAFRLRPEVIDAWLSGYAYQLKFVVSSAQDLLEIRTLIKQLRHEVKPHHILLMPEGTDVESIRERTTTLLKICKADGFRYCNRLHIELFGNTPST